MIGIPRKSWANQGQWAVTAPLLFASLAGVEGALSVALGLCAITTVACADRHGTLRAYPVQIRIGFMMVAGLGLIHGLEPVLWIPAFGTTSQVLLGYCPMARFLDLMPWNRADALSWCGFAEVVTRAPGNEGLLIPS